MFGSRLQPFVAAEAAEYLRITPLRVVELCRSGALRATQPGGKAWLILPSDLEAYILAGFNDVEHDVDQEASA